MRRAAVEALASNFKDEDTKAFLKTLATDDQDEDVRSAAVQALGKYFRYQLELFDIYHNCAVHDSFEGSHDEYNPNPRRIALEIIVKQFSENDQTLPLLHDRAENDPDEKVREYAQKKLAELEV
ncbi:MAG: HEAT repeat domain-containing protein [Fischerella sp. CENA71]|nr:HEAT repeat domain-containing protein [Fischerella sp. CENA71]